MWSRQGRPDEDLFAKVAWVGVGERGVRAATVSAFRRTPVRAGGPERRAVNVDATDE